MSTALPEDENTYNDERFVYTVSQVDPHPVPTASEWGMIVMAGLILCSGALACAKRQRQVAAGG